MAAETPVGLEEEPLAEPLHFQRVQSALRLEPLLKYVENHVNKQPGCHSKPGGETTTDADTDLDTGKDTGTDEDSSKLYNGIVVSKADRKVDKSRLYNFTKVKKSRRWLKNVLLSDSSSEDEDMENGLSSERLADILKQHKYVQKCRQNFYQDGDLQQYQYYSVGLLSNYDKFYEHQKVIVGPKKKAAKEQKRLEKKLMKARLKELKKKAQMEAKAEKAASGTGPGRPSKTKKPTPEQLAARRRRLWVSISKKEIPRAQKQKASARKEMMASLRKVAKEGQKESRRAALQSQKLMREGVVRARRLSKEMMVYWKRFDKVEKEHRRKAEKEAQEQRKMDVEHREMKRQQRKLNFLITQTELYAHFMSRKLTGETDTDRDRILSRLDEYEEPSQPKTVKGGMLTDFMGADYDSEEARARAMRNAKEAYNTHQKKTQAFDRGAQLKTRTSTEEGMDLANPTISDAAERPQATIFEGKLKGYQLKGMNWLANLYDQGINGILADEMGLGKTVQSIAFLAHLAEEQSIWGPFLVVAPASTLHNWQQEISRFLPKFKVVPYWGNTQDRKILRKFWNQDHLHMQDASFHVCITSYQLVIQDVKYFQRIKWHYMILDEAQALKSTASVRWKILLGFNCRNRLLLTGTPIQNTMQELWALLHFIMPTMFDSHEEFNEWFSKDIEGHAENKCSIDENQLSRLHMILKPFMLRRVKKDVENELSDKIEVLVYCPLTTRQKILYKGIKMKISIEDLLQSATAASSHQAQSSTSSLMNLVMQFRKVCNHPELFERREISTPCFINIPAYSVPKLVYREGLLDTATPSKRHLLYNRFYIFSPNHVHKSLFPPHHTGGAVAVDSCFSFSRFTEQSAAELYSSMFSGLLVRWLAILVCLKEAYRIQHEKDWRIKPTQTRYLNQRSLVIWPEGATSAPALATSPCLRALVFTQYTNSVYAHTQHKVHYIPETLPHRKIRLRRLSGKVEELKTGPLSPRRGLHSPPVSPTKKTPLSPTRKSHTHTHSHSVHHGPKPHGPNPRDIDPSSLPAHPHLPRRSRVLDCIPTEMPSFLYYTVPKACSAPLKTYSSDRSAAWDTVRQHLCGTLDARNSLLHGSPQTAERVKWRHLYFQPTSPEGMYALQPKHGYSKVNVPGKSTLVTDAGKLTVLDSLLGRLKCEGHRVLIYSQMTRMIDLLEEYMWHRKHTYMRLDGSSKISDRRDMVANFQTRSDIFVFLLSTRAGGLGINLTAADTVIFYDSDWNPTVDQQAMDRAHRLGQTKQVTVYRLICNGTIEERILQRAKEKSEIQRMVISGGNFRPDVLKPKEVVSLLLDDDEMEKKLRQKQEEKHHREEMGHRGPGRPPNKEKKRKPYQKTGRGPGRPPKKPKKPEDDHNLTIPAVIAQDLEASWLDSPSAAASPQSVLSACSESTLQSLNIVDDSSNDGLVIVDDGIPVTPTATPPPAKRGPGRPRGRPRGSGVGRRPRGRGSVQKALSAAEAAAAASAKSAAYAAYGYNFTGSTTPGKGMTTPSKRGGHHSSTPRASTSTTPTHSNPTTPRASPRGFYSQRPTTPH